MLLRSRQRDQLEGLHGSLRPNPKAPWSLVMSLTRFLLVAFAARLLKVEHIMVSTDTKEVIRALYVRSTLVKVPIDPGPTR